MAFTTDQYTALVAAISQGANRVRYADKEVQYNSLSEMLKLKDLMEKELGLKKSGIKTTYAGFSNGLNKC
ncbi:phage head-tail joining protein [Chitinophaga sp. CF418]|uniref:phage head-tail joining protein n=1 Tax=Chitinophaga sp. CF418 TaxID=1855287 RepID=UPI00091F7D0A|nr:hypothetical protein SAMN05216311_12229 [Chitinophaga sp. CF418]